MLLEKVRVVEGDGEGFIPGRPKVISASDGGEESRVDTRWRSLECERRRRIRQLLFETQSPQKTVLGRQALARKPWYVEKGKGMGMGMGMGNK
jgi:hypothetical protein